MYSKEFTNTDMMYTSDHYTTNVKLLNSYTINVDCKISYIPYNGGGKLDKLL